MSHPLNDPWTIFVAKKSPVGTYSDNLVSLSTVTTVEQFCDVFTQLQNPQYFPTGYGVFVCRSGYKPLWEKNPAGGTLSVRLHRSCAFVDFVWTKFVFSLIGEQFDDPNVVCCGFSCRSDYNLSIWINNAKSVTLKNRANQKFISILHSTYTGSKFPLPVVEFVSHTEALELRQQLESRPAEEST
ncbi:hypothetical protein GEMRC1_007387 [Eukaryota sp. GEM-RC1]